MTGNYWEGIVHDAVSRYSTPMYICSWLPVESAIQELQILQPGIPIRHWLSLKTHPVAPMVRKWKSIGFGIEVVTEYEFLAARREGFDGKKILVNGTAKHTWLSKHDTNDIIVNFDSLTEIDNLIGSAKTNNWQVGFRIHVEVECDPDETQYGGQFGLIPREVGDALDKVRNAGIIPQIIHFHIGTNVLEPYKYLEAIEEIAGICDEHDFKPEYLDCGGGLPVKGENPHCGEDLDGEIDLGELNKAFMRIPRLIPSVSEIWLENGRFMTSRSSILVMKVNDIKERQDSRYLICDGGRVNNALVSDWELHDITTYPTRRGEKCHTTICGPTCMAYDRIARCSLPCDIGIGDYIIWHNAGAYHIPWETRFSHGFINVIWLDEKGSLSLVRPEETFDHWWGMWVNNKVD